MSERILSFQEALNSHFDYQTGSMYTAIPGVVVSIVSLKEQRIHVQPSINVRNVDGDINDQRPPILNVPLHMPVTDLGGLTYPISTGTPVYLIFSMRGLETWKRSNGKPEAPSDMRKFDMRDCVAIPGIVPFAQSTNSSEKRTNEHSVDDVVLVHNIGSGAEVEVRLKPNGDVFINSPKKVTVNCVDAEVNADENVDVNTNKITINTTDMFVNGNFIATSPSFQVKAGNFDITADNSASITGSIDMTGSFRLNGTTVEDHDHGGIQTGTSRTDPFGG